MLKRKRQGESRHILLVVDAIVIHQKGELLCDQPFHDVFCLLLVTSVILPIFSCPVFRRGAPEGWRELPNNGRRERACISAWFPFRRHHHHRVHHRGERMARGKPDGGGYFSGDALLCRRRVEIIEGGSTADVFQKPGL